MKFTKLLTVAIVVLLALNIFLGISLYSLRRDTDYISDKTVDETIELLKGSGVQIESNVIPKEKAEYQIIQLSYATDSESYYRSVAMLFPDFDENSELYMTESGVRITGNDGVASAEFSDTNPLYIEYCAGGDYDYCREKVTQLAISDYDLSTDSGMQYIDKLNTQFCFTDTTALYLRLNGIKYNPEYGVKLVEWCEYFGQYSLCTAYGYALFDENDSLFYFEGTLVTGTYESRLSTDLYDVINVLFDEKSENTTENLTVNYIDVCYYPKVLTETSKLYLIPAYSLDTDAGVHVRSMLDGKLVKS